MPEIDRSLATPAEQDAQQHLLNLLSELGTLERNFRLAVYLYDYCRAAFQETPPFRNDQPNIWEIFFGWQLMAARDGALTIYHFGRTLEAISEGIGSVQELCKRTDTKAISNIIRIFKGAFPNWIKSRHSVAHQGDSASVEKRTQHSVGETFLPGNLVNNVFSVTNDEAIYSYELSIKNADKLASYKRRVLAAFPVTSQPSA